MNTKKTEGIPLYLVERLLILAEECAEVTQCVSKILRFGVNTPNYYKPEVTNRDNLAMEIGDVMGLINILIDYGLITQDEIDAQAVKKIEKMKSWTQWNKDGTQNYANKNNT